MNKLTELFDSKIATMFTNEGKQDFLEVYRAAVSATREDVETLAKHFYKFNNERTIALQPGFAEDFKSFLLSGQRVAAYGTDVWKGLRAVVDFIESGSNDVPVTVFEQMVNLVASSKFVDVQSVLSVALPISDTLEPLVTVDARHHQFARIIGDIVSKRGQEAENGMAFSDRDWKNAELIALSAMKFPIDAVESI